MKIAISNLAWDKIEDRKVISILKKYDIKGIEIAPTKIWKNPTRVSEKSIKKYRKFWEDNEIKIIATTSLLFGHPELTLFGNPKKTLDYLKKQAFLAKALGAKVMMFGSPKNRIKGDLSNGEAVGISSGFFYKIADFCTNFEICFAIEPNPPIYGGDFILTTKEAVELVKRVNHKNFGLNLDSSTIASNKSGYDTTVKLALPHTCHAHISEPLLKPIPYGVTNHKAFAKALKRYSYDKWLSIEMPLGPGVNHLEQIQKTLDFVTKIFN